MPITRGGGRDWRHASRSRSMRRATSLSQAVPALCRGVSASRFSVSRVTGHGRSRAYARASGLLRGMDALFCGDTLFGAGCGGLFEGTPAQMSASLARIAALPETTRIYCAHEYTADEPAFRLASRAGRTPGTANARCPGRPNCVRPACPASKYSGRGKGDQSFPALPGACGCRSGVGPRGRRLGAGRRLCGDPWLAKQFLGFFLAQAGADLFQRIEHARAVEGLDDEAAGTVLDRLLEPFPGRSCW